jgi:hypothetical protein
VVFLACDHVKLDLANITQAYGVIILPACASNKVHFKIIKLGLQSFSDLTQRMRGGRVVRREKGRVRPLGSKQIEEM